jgi:hypothetical protein
MGYDDRAFAAALVGLAVRGYCTIMESDGEYTVRKTDKERTGMAPEEIKLLEKLFAKSDKITLKNANHSTISKAIGAVRRSLALNYEKRYFVSNMGYFVPGLIVSLLFIVVAFVLGFMESPETFMQIWLTFWSAGVAFLLWKVLGAWREAFGTKRGLRRLFASGGAVFLTLFSCPLWALKSSSSIFISRWEAVAASLHCVHHTHQSSFLLSPQGAHPRPGAHSWTG